MKKLDAIQNRIVWSNQQFFCGKEHNFFSPSIPLHLSHFTCSDSLVMKHSLKFATFLSCYDIRNFGVLQRFCHEKNSILARNLCWKDKRICIPQHTMFPTLNLPSCLLSETIEIVLSLTSAYMDKNTRFIQEKYQNFHNSHERNIAPNNHVTILL